MSHFASESALGVVRPLRCHPKEGKGENKRISHAPGPWEWRYEPDQTISTTVCERVKATFRKNDNNTMKQEAEANARLIAAAPQLLAILLAYRTLGSNWQSINLDHLHKLADEVIAKAEGRDV